MSNLDLWKSVEKTNPAHTKRAKIGQMNITAICPQYQRMTATEQFGPFGEGWGVDSPDYSFMDFPDGTKLCTYTATMWYMRNDKKCCFPIQSNTKVAFVTKGGQGYLKIDDEYAKKAATDALTKGLSMLGFNSDVFLGKYDDNKYVSQVMEEFNPAPPAKPSKDQINALVALAKIHKLQNPEMNKIMGQFGFKHSSEITLDKYQAVMDAVNNTTTKG